MKLLAFITFIQIFSTFNKPEDLPIEIFFTSKISLKEFAFLAQKLRDQYKQNEFFMKSYYHCEIAALQRIFGKDWQTAVGEEKDLDNPEFLKKMIGRNRGDVAMLIDWGMRHHSPVVRSIAHESIGLDQNRTIMSIDRITEGESTSASSSSIIIPRTKSPYFDSPRSYRSRSTSSDDSDGPNTPNIVRSDSPEDIFQMDED